MYEVELKLRADHDRVRDRLVELDAERVGTVEQTDTYFHAPHRDFAATDEALRIRREDRDGEHARLTYKGPRLEAASKTREEIEAGVGDAEATSALLEALGFEPAATVRKERERFDLEGFTVVLDAVDGLGEFLEIETEVEREGAIEPRREAAAALLGELGLDPDGNIRTSYLGMLLDGDSPE